MAHPMGESKPGPLRVGFDRRLKLEFHGSQISSDGGLLPYRELDEMLGLSRLAGDALSEVRRGKNTRHLLAGLLRQSVYGRLAGYEDVNDAERLCHDPVMRAIVDRKGLEGSAASSSQIGRFETAWLASEDNLAALADLSGAWIDRARWGSKTIVLDIDSSVSPTHGEQEGSSYNGPSAVAAITRCSSSTSSATWSGASCAPAMFTRPRAGASYWSRWSPDTGIGPADATSGPIPPSRHRRSMHIWRPRVSSMRYACPATKSSSGASATC